ncbi:hypothetical protein [Methanolobus psychrotolerans]|uniref:hypothetical protein n=1 Tax=Methanolobus psychrotolerans TaxID=1874706 RepID=UPI000B917D74|nr:hypothetical protein [Methanolobus psychrotolerans]
MLMAHHHLPLSASIFTLGYVLAKFLKLSYQDAAPSSMIGASNHFEVYRHVYNSVLFLALLADLKVSQEHTH